MASLGFFVVTFCQIFFGGGFFSSRRIRSRPRRQPHFTIITVLGCFDFGSAPMFFLIEEALTDLLVCGVSLSCFNWVHHQLGPGDCTFHVRLSDSISEEQYKRSFF